MSDDKPKRQRLFDVLYDEDDKQKIAEIDRRTDKLNVWNSKRRGMEDGIATALDNIYKAICVTQKKHDVKVDTYWLRDKFEVLINKLEQTEDDLEDE